jgi:hypothetical protein
MIKFNYILTNNRNIKLSRGFMTFNYEELAGRTENRELDQKQYPKELFKNVINVAILSGQFLDLYKKHYFYNKKIDQQELANLTSKLIGAIDRTAMATTSEVAECDYGAEINHTLTTQEDILRARLFHSGVGMITEAGEILENLPKHNIDWVNVGEELGDVDWYQAIILNILKDLNIPLDENIIRERNILKLAKRYGEKFSDFSATHRDLESERKILEGK